MERQVIVSSVFFAVIALANLPAGAKALEPSSIFPCNLVWKQVDIGSPVGTDWVPLHLNLTATTGGGPASEFDEFIIKIRRNDGERITGASLGTIRPELKGNPKVYQATPARMFPGKGKENVYMTYDVLTNPHGCTLSWNKCNFGGPLSRAYVRVSGDTGNFVSRQRIVEPENAGADSFLMHIAEEWEEPRSSGGILECLRAAAKMDVVFSQFEFDYSVDDKSGSDFLGTDLIENQAETTVTQIVEHRKLFGETFSFTQSQSWSYLSSCTFGISVNLFFVNLELTVTDAVTVGATSETTKEFYKETEVKSSRQINVPPFTSVEACSTMDFNDGFTLQYTGQARHTSQSMTVSQIEEEIKRIGYTNYRREGNSVVVELTGTIQGKMALRTAFYVTSTNDQSSCYNLKRKYQERDWLRSRANATRLMEVEQEISEMKRNMERMKRH